MDNSFILSLDTLGIIVCAIIAIGVILLRLNKKVRDYLKKHLVADAFVGTLLVITIWFICGQFMVWWLAAIIALVVTFCIDRKI